MAPKPPHSTTQRRPTPHSAPPPPTFNGDGRLRDPWRAFGARAKVNKLPAPSSTALAELLCRHPGRGRRLQTSAEGGLVSWLEPMSRGRLAASEGWTRRRGRRSGGRPTRSDGSALRVCCKLHVVAVLHSLPAYRSSTLRYGFEIHRPTTCRRCFTGVNESCSGYGKAVSRHTASGSAAAPAETGAG